MCFGFTPLLFSDVKRCSHHQFLHNHNGIYMGRKTKILVLSFLSILGISTARINILRTEGGHFSEEFRDTLSSLNGTWIVKNIYNRLFNFKEVKYGEKSQLESTVECMQGVQDIMKYDLGCIKVAAKLTKFARIFKFYIHNTEFLKMNGMITQNCSKYQNVSRNICNLILSGEARLLNFDKLKSLINACYHEGVIQNQINDKGNHTENTFPKWCGLPSWKRLKGCSIIFPVEDDSPHSRHRSSFCNGPYSCQLVGKKENCDLAFDCFDR